MTLCKFSNGDGAVVIMAISSPACVRYLRSGYSTWITFHTAAGRKTAQIINTVNEVAISCVVITDNICPS